MDRRTFIGALAAAAYSFPAMAEPGLPVSPSMMAAFRSLQGVREGNGRGTLHILFAPWCHISPDIYRESRGMLNALSFNWIPFSGGQPEGSEATERLLANPVPSAISATFTPLQRMGVKPSTPLSDAQDAAIEARVAPLVAREATRNIVTPTLLYSMGSERLRLVLGGPGRKGLEEIARLAT